MNQEQTEKLSRSTRQRRKGLALIAASIFIILAVILIPSSVLTFLPFTSVILILSLALNVGFISYFIFKL